MLEKPSKYRAALFGGIAIGLVSSIPGLNLINCCCCAGIILGGVLSVYLYNRSLEEGMPPLEASDAVILGVMAGVAGAFISTVVDLLFLAAIGPVGMEFVRSIVEGLLESLEESGSIAPEMSDQIRDQLEEALAESSTATGIVSGLFFNLIIHPIFAMLGALLGYVIFRPKKRLDQQTPAPIQ
jgi:hypothetical protein